MLAQPRLGMRLDDRLRVLKVDDGGACWGHMHVGDIITHVNSVPMAGKDPKAVIEICSTAWRVMLDIERTDGSTDPTSNKLKILIRLPLPRPEHTREEIKKQIEAGSKLHRDDAEIRRVFSMFAKMSSEMEPFAHIPKGMLFAALTKLGLDVVEENIDVFFDKHDSNKDGQIDYEEFQNLLITPPGMPQAREMREIFNAHSIKSAEANVDPYVPTDKLRETLKALGLKTKATDRVLEYFALGAGADDKISFEELNQAVRSAAPQHDEQKVAQVYEEHAIAGTYEFIPRQELQAALKELGILMTDEQQKDYQRIVDLNFNSCIRYKAFKHIVLLPSPQEAWAGSLPLSRLLADALPKHSSCDHLRVISTLSPKEIGNIALEVSTALKDMIQQHVLDLREAFMRMDNMILQPGVHHASKFEVVQMTGGTIKDFYDGLEARIGSCPSDFKEAMRAEHCELAGCDYQFSTMNYNEIKTSPKKEWDIVMKCCPCPEVEMRYNRRIPDIAALCKLPLVAKANLREAEVVAMVLYTGPMYVVYNGLPRKFPKDMYEDFKKNDNLFETTIFVLASAVQKISRVMKLPSGLVLYRGLGGTSDLPDSFFKTDEYGCHGFVEWGFMSTTSSKQVAINYSGISKQKPLPIVLAIHVGAADRGACIREFSQYPSEVEYLYAPCSFIQQLRSESLEVTSEGVVRIMPVKVNANLKAELVDELERKKRYLHLASFKYRIYEVKLELKKMAEEKGAEKRLASDLSHDQKLTVALFIEKIVSQCQDVFSRHQSIGNEEYNNDRKFRSLVMEMIDVKDMALSKFTEWLTNEKSSFIKFRFEAPLRTVHRRWMAFLEKQNNLYREEDKKSGSLLKLKKSSLELLTVRGVVIDSVDEMNELGETRIMCAAAEGRSGGILKLLSNASADVNGARPDGVTPIWLAAQFDHRESIKALVELQASVNQAANNGATPLYIAAQSGNVECIQLLAELKANLSQGDNAGVTPAHQAAMNGCSTCIQLLKNLGADVNTRDNKGATPFDYAQKHRREECMEVLKDLQGSSMPTKSVSSPSKAENSKKLIISTGDISDIDGFLALAHYARSGADVLFVMNYPAYVGVSESEVDPTYADRNPGLGYKYSASQVFHSEKLPKPLPEKYKQFLSHYDAAEPSDNMRMKCALTDMAFAMATRVWAEVETERKGDLLFSIGGINAVNPFSPTAIKNEILVYSAVVAMPEKQLDPKQSQVYNSQGQPLSMNWDIYSDIYMDFNGSLAFWDDTWEHQLTSISDKISGVFVMGGVYSHTPPITMPSLPNVLNRFSSATMNQLYHPEAAARFFSLLASQKISTFVVPNNTVEDLVTFSDEEKKIKTYEGVENFLRSNNLNGPFLRSLTDAHYNSPQGPPPRKPFDFYTALALTSWLRAGHVHPQLKSDPKSLFYSNVYGITYVSTKATWVETLLSYTSCIDITENDDDPPFIKGKKELFRKEIDMLHKIPFAGKVPVFDVQFTMDKVSKQLTVS